MRLNWHYTPGKWVVYVIFTPAHSRPMGRERRRTVSSAHLLYYRGWRDGIFFLPMNGGAFCRGLCFHFFFRSVLFDAQFVLEVGLWLSAWMRSYINVPQYSWLICVLFRTVLPQPILIWSFFVLDFLLMLNAFETHVQSTDT